MCSACYIAIYRLSLQCVGLLKISQNQTSEWEKRNIAWLDLITTHNNTQQKCIYKTCNIIKSRVKLFSSPVSVYTHSYYTCILTKPNTLGTYKRCTIIYRRFRARNEVQQVQRSQSVSLQICGRVRQCANSVLNELSFRQLFPLRITKKKKKLSFVSIHINSNSQWAYCCSK